jgi:hypothetical protein
MYGLVVITLSIKVYNPADVPDGEGPAMRRMTPRGRMDHGSTPVAADTCQAEITKLSRVKPAAAGLYTFIDSLMTTRPYIHQMYGLVVIRLSILKTCCIWLTAWAFNLNVYSVFEDTDKPTQIFVG